MPATSPRKPANGWTILGKLYLIAGFVFLMLPIVTLVVFSFQKNQYASLPGQGWSLRFHTIGTWNQGWNQISPARG